MSYPKKVPYGALTRPTQRDVVDARWGGVPTRRDIVAAMDIVADDLRSPTRQLGLEGVEDHLGMHVVRVAGLAELGSG